MEIPGNEALTLNQEYSSAALPLKVAFMYEPVRISPGTMVVTATPLPVSSARNPSENPTAANFEALYGSRCGMLTMPPIEVMLTILPARRSSMWGSTARVVFTTPQKFTSIACLKSECVCDSIAPT